MPPFVVPNWIQCRQKPRPELEYLSRGAAVYVHHRYRYISCRLEAMCRAL
jgi:hypothetical protein